MTSATTPTTATLADVIAKLQQHEAAVGVARNALNEHAARA